VSIVKNRIKQGIFILIVFVELLLIVSSAKGIVQLLAVRERVSLAQENVSELERKQTELKDELAWRQSEVYREQEIRDQLHLAKPGEVVVYIDESEYKQQESEDDEKGGEELANWQKWVELFLVK
jgi:cell division protein FtsB